MRSPIATDEVFLIAFDIVVMSLFVAAFAAYYVFGCKMLYLVGRATACVKLCLLLADPAIEEWATGTLDLN